MVYNNTMFEKLEAFVIENVLHSTMFDYIYKSVYDSDKNAEHVVKELGHTTYFMDFHDGFKAVMKSKIQPYFEEDLEITEIAFARYHNASGYVPKLFPHFDGFDEHRITFDIQLNSTIDWPIFIEGQEFTLKNNNALVFSGTDQIHWRKEMVLSENDFTDMLFIHLSLKNNNEKISEEFKKNRDKKLKYFQKNVNIPSAAIKTGE